MNEAMELMPLFVCLAIILWVAKLAFKLKNENDILEGKLRNLDASLKDSNDRARVYKGDLDAMKKMRQNAEFETVQMTTSRQVKLFPDSAYGDDEATKRAARAHQQSADNIHLSMLGLGYPPAMLHVSDEPCRPVRLEGSWDVSPAPCSPSSSSTYSSSSDSSSSSSCDSGSSSSCGGGD